MISIRPATFADAALIAHLSRITFYETFASSNTKEDMDKFMSEQFTVDMLMDEVKDNENIFYLAYDGNEPAGYVRIRAGERRNEFGNKPAIEIARIYAAKSFYGKGVGQALMNQCLACAEEMKKEIIWLGVWEKNVRAIAFYEKWGFEKFAEHDFILGNDVQRDWLMKKII